MTRMSAHSYSEENNAVCIRVIHKGYNNPKQLRHGNESRTAQRARSRDSTRWIARVRILITDVFSILIFLFHEDEVYSVNKLKSFKTSKLNYKKVVVNRVAGNIGT